MSFLVRRQPTFGHPKDRHDKQTRAHVQRHALNGPTATRNSSSANVDLAASIAFKNADQSIGLHVMRTDHVVLAAAPAEPFFVNLFDGVAFLDRLLHPHTHAGNKENESHVRNTDTNVERTLALMNLTSSATCNDGASVFFSTPVAMNCTTLCDTMNAGPRWYA